MHHTHAKPGIKRLAPALLGAAAMLITPLVTHAAADVAKMTSHGSAISWHPAGTYQSASLTISAPDGSVTQQDFARQDQISITAPATDGTYSYELVLTPRIPPGLRARMDDHRANHPGEKFMNGLQGGSKSGSFSISGGSVIDGTQAE